MPNPPRLLASFLLAAAALAGCGDGDALAVVDDEPVSREEFEAYLKFKRLPVGEKDTQRFRNVLDQYVQRKAMARAIERRLEEGGPIDAAALEAELDDFRREQLITRYFEKYLAQAVTDAAVDAWYASHAADYAERRVHVAHILVRTPRAGDPGARSAAEARIQEAAAKLKAGMAWEQAVGAYSQDAISAKKAGDLGWIQQGAIDAKLSEVAFGMEPGAPSAPFETQYGFHIVKVLEGPSVRQRPLETVKGEIRYRLRSEAKEAELKKLAASVEVRTKAPP